MQLGCLTGGPRLRISLLGRFAKATGSAWRSWWERTGAMKESLLALMAGILVWVCGCRDKNHDVEAIEGVVCASRTDIIESYLLVVTACCRNDCDPLPNAKIELAFDEKGRKPIKGFEATSGEKGRYTISL